MRSIRVSAAVIHRDGMIYATRRGKGEFRGYWEFPGGKREEGENGEEAAVREIKEELCATIAVERFLVTVEYDYPSFHLTMDAYLASIADGELTLSEHSEARWLPLEYIDSVDWLPADILIVDELKSHFGL